MTEERLIEVASCDALDARGALSLVVSPDQDGTLLLRGTAEALNETTVEQGETLLIQTLKNDRVDGELRCGCPREIRLLGAVDLAGAACSLERLGVYGGSRAALNDISGEHLDLRVAGAGQLAMEAVDAEFIQLLASGSSQSYLSGRLDGAVFDVAGAAQLNAEDLPGQSITVHARGATQTIVNATAHLYLEQLDTAQVKNVGDGETTTLGVE